MREALERVLSHFPTPPPIVTDGNGGFEAAWSNERVSAGLRTFERQVFVFLSDAIVEVTSVSEATEILRGIFADRIVAVAAFASDALLRCYLAPADNIGAGLNNPNHFYLGPIATPADQVRVRSWSGALDSE